MCVTRKLNPVHYKYYKETPSMNFSKCKNNFDLCNLFIIFNNYMKRLENVVRIYEKRDNGAG